MIDEVLFGTTEKNLGWIARAGFQVGGLWDETWGNGPLSDPNGDGLVLSPIGWGWCVLASTVAAGAAMAMYAMRVPGVIPHRSALRGWAIESADHERRFAAAQALVAWRVLAVWGFAAPTCAAILSVWLVESDGGEQLGNPLRVLLVTLMAASAMFAISAFVGARWARRDVLRMCDACIDCGYPRQVAGERDSAVCSECGSQRADRPHRRLHPAVRVCIVVTCWILPWIALGWMAFEPRPVGGAWIPFDSPRVIHLKSGQDVFVEAEWIGPRDLPAPGSRSFDVRFTLELRRTKDHEVLLAPRERVLHFSGDHTRSSATDSVYLIDQPGDAELTKSGLRFRILPNDANDHCVMLLTSVAVVGISEIREP